MSSAYSGLAAITQNLGKSPKREQQERVAKTADPSLEKTGVIVNRDAKRKAFQRFEDLQPRVKGTRRPDFSDLVNKLICAYADGRIDV